MGKLRSSIDQVIKTAGTLETATNTLVEQRTKLRDTLLHHGDRCRGGADVMYMYLMEKFKSQGKKIETQKKTTIKEVFDAELGAMIKGVLEARTAVLKVLSEGDKVHQFGLALKANIGKLRTDLVAIQAIIDKKKKKWLTSSKYKAKLSGYEAAVAELDGSLKTLAKLLPDVKFGASTKPDDWHFSTATTVEQIYQAASTSLQDDLNMDKKTDEAIGKQFRGRFFAKSLDTLKEWGKFADDMEAEADESDSTEAAPDPSPKILDLTVKLGSTALATAKSGEYARKSQVLVTELTWKKGFDPLQYLQKKLVVTGKYENKAEGDFKSEMKLDKVGGDLRKATFKG